METFGNKIKQNSATKFYCEKCCYGTVRKSNYEAHLNSTRHQNGNHLETKLSKIKQDAYSCEICKKSFKNRSGLWKHNNKFHFDPSIKPSSQITTELVLELIQNNKEMKQIILEQNSTINTLVSKSGIINNINNTTINATSNAFNLNLFLNETCKEAINMSDFVNSIKISIDDLENTGRRGYIDGITSIITKNLNGLEQHNRPLHCSDLKREVLYIKDNGTWEKETEDKPILINAIKNIANKNIQQIQEWRNKYPDCTDSESKKNNMYLKIVSNSMNGLTEEEGRRNINKIISNIAKEIVIQKK